MKKILLILTGGTICSKGNEQGNHRKIHMDEAKTRLLQNFRASDSKFCDCAFEVVTVLDILSENMTIERWNELLDFFKGLSFVDYEGILIAHGTDTLSYMASLTALLLSGSGLPVFLVSSDHPLDDVRANGNDHFKRSVELIGDGIRPGTYVVYRNKDGKNYLHKASHLMACGDYSNDFFSNDALQLDQKEMKEIQAWIGETEGQMIQLSSIGQLQSNVLLLKPYVGLDYRFVKIDQEIRAIVHGLYHSATACVAGKTESLLWLMKECRQREIPVFITPCRKTARYVSGDQMLAEGAIPVYGMTTEMVYVKTMVGCALGLAKEELISFLRTNVCGEFFEVD